MPKLPKRRSRHESPEETRPEGANSASPGARSSGSGHSRYYTHLASNRDSSQSSELGRGRGDRSRHEDRSDEPAWSDASEAAVGQSKSPDRATLMAPAATNVQQYHNIQHPHPHQFRNYHDVYLSQRSRDRASETAAPDRRPSDFHAVAEGAGRSLTHPRFNGGVNLAEPPIFSPGLVVGQEILRKILGACELFFPMNQRSQPRSNGFLTEIGTHRPSSASTTTSRITTASESPEIITGDLDATRYPEDPACPSGSRHLGGLGRAAADLSPENRVAAVPIRERDSQGFTNSGDSTGTLGRSQTDKKSRKRSSKSLPSDINEPGEPEPKMNKQRRITPKKIPREAESEAEKRKRIFCNEFDELKEIFIIRERQERIAKRTQREGQSPETAEVSYMQLRAAVVPELMEKRVEFPESEDRRVHEWRAEYNHRVDEPEWTADAQATFKKMFAPNPKFFHKIAPAIPNKTVSQCIKFYYKSKLRKREDLLPLRKQIRKKIEREKKRALAASRRVSAPRRNERRSGGKSLDSKDVARSSRSNNFCEKPSSETVRPEAVLMLSWTTREMERLFEALGRFGDMATLASFVGKKSGELRARFASLDVSLGGCMPYGGRVFSHQPGFSISGYYTFHCVW